jgi:hypothetical protein
VGIAVVDVVAWDVVGDGAVTVVVVPVTVGALVVDVGSAVGGVVTAVEVGVTEGVGVAGGAVGRPR